MDPKVPSENTIELYDLSPQRMVGLPVSASRVIYVQKCRVRKHVGSFPIIRALTMSLIIHVGGQYICVVLWSGVGLCFVQGYDKQAALDGLQDGLVVRINAY